MPITPLTTAARVAARMGLLAVELRTDDDAVTPGAGADESASALTAEAIADATVEARGYLSRMYSDTQLAGSDWVELKVRDIAVYYLCLRRLNDAPAAAVQPYEKAIADLEKVQSGAMPLPDAATRKAAAPTLSNQRVRVWPVPHVVSTPHNSTGNPQNYDRNEDPSDYEPNING